MASTRIQTERAREGGCVCRRIAIAYSYPRPYTGRESLLCQGELGRDGGEIVSDPRRGMGAGEREAHSPFGKRDENGQGRPITTTSTASALHRMHAADARRAATRSPASRALMLLLLLLQ